MRRRAAHHRPMYEITDADAAFADAGGLGADVTTPSPSALEAEARRPSTRRSDGEVGLRSTLGFDATSHLGAHRRQSRSVVSEDRSSPSLLSLATLLLTAGALVAIVVLVLTTLLSRDRGATSRNPAPRRLPVAGSSPPAGSPRGITHPSGRARSAPARRVPRATARLSHLGAGAHGSARRRPRRRRGRSGAQGLPATSAAPPGALAEGDALSSRNQSLRASQPSLGEESRESAEGSSPVGVEEGSQESADGSSSVGVEEGSEAQLPPVSPLLQQLASTAAGSALEEFGFER